jgi:hypothetical protein
MIVGRTTQDPSLGDAAGDHPAAELRAEAT